jgi:hypothetical protein
MGEAHYAKVGGSQILISLYKSRYTIIVAWIYLVGLLSSDIVDRYFEPQAYLDASGAANEKKLSG